MSVRTHIKQLLVAALGLSLIPGPAVFAADQPSQVLPPLSYPTVQYLNSHPGAWAKLQAQMAGISAPAAAPALSPIINPWHAVTTAPFTGLCNPLLLTDGTVMVHSCNTKNWYKLTPDIFGNYATGTWSAIASLPIINGVQYAPQYHAGAVMYDGRVLIEGGEYNGGNSAVWTNLGAIYDPVADTWKPVTAPAGWTKIGDAPGINLANKKFMLGGCCNSPAANVIFNPTKLTWVSTPAPSAGANYQNEQGYALLPNADVLTIDIWTNYSAHGDAVNTERYSAKAPIGWSSAGNTPVPLADPYSCGTFEIGPHAVRGDGTVVGFGGNTGCLGGAAAVDPTAIYNVAANSWSAGPSIPSVCGAGASPCDLADAPAALLPNGNILFAASAGYGGHPTHFFEFTSGNQIVQVADPLFNASTSGAYYYNFVNLPNGQILMTDFSNVAEVYTPTGSPVAAWAPSITSIPSAITRGTSYVVKGKQLNGVSEGSYYGDDAQTSTNYPILQIKNNATGHIFYARTSKHSTMSIKPKAGGSTHFVVPASVPAGAATATIIANGIASVPFSVTIN